ncbi:MAG: cupin domain-containing protein [Bacteroidia bacterium]|nr:cupin domain-containing protein [Bacteroidia bacterium]MCF8426698.1 cupin domain-containing protein [Bacteroidia bacterium]MCF8445962.1 cupin domain-containing protein [Bacteroidia bacterium]
MQKNAAYYIEKLGLTQHVEGGAFAETYRCANKIDKNNLPDTFHGDRNYGTAIYFLLTQGDFSAFHKIASDEIWHFYEGSPLHIYELDQTGKLNIHHLGRDLEKGESYQCVIQAGNWFASRCETKNGFSLVGCTVAPGFDFEDFELANKESLTKEFPQHQEIIKELCR